MRREGKTTANEESASDSWRFLLLRNGRYDDGAVERASAVSCPPDEIERRDAICMTIILTAKICEDGGRGATCRRGWCGHAEDLRAGRGARGRGPSPCPGRRPCFSPPPCSSTPGCSTARWRPSPPSPSKGQDVYRRGIRTPRIASSGNVTEIGGCRCGPDVSGGAG